MKNVNSDTKKVTTVSKTGNNVDRMSHTVTVTRTTTTSTTSAIIINTGYLKTVPGILKLLEVIIAGVCLFLVSWYDVYLRRTPYLFFFSIVTTAFVASSCLLLACLISLSTASIIAKTIYELVYHVVLCVLVLISSILFFVEVENHSKNYYYHNQYMTCAILGLILGVLYLVSTVFAYRNYRGL
ncbi:uncharacterized protein LOC106664233 isoform X1 [Cimex lectularius]|uniref:MARVEL domain-containing protein n=2 Tax=Cimex lectularius TaxID=79782 RepID=A0A8I6TD12_CIMLE|nr:uncharacterized protein LOC106664233 isoform X1 [Cimex lectularius]